MDHKLGGINLVRWQGARVRKSDGPAGWIVAAALLLMAVVGLVAVLVPASPWVDWLGFAAMAPALLAFVAMVIVRLVLLIRPAVVWLFS